MSKAKFDCILTFELRFVFLFVNVNCGIVNFRLIDVYLKHCFCLIVSKLPIAQWSYGQILVSLQRK